MSHHYKSILSVIVPTYNRFESLKRCISALCNQTYPFIEIIIVNDGSTDGTKNYLESLSHNRIKIIHFPNNCGGNRARNAGIIMSSAPYIGFCDDDDEWLPEKTDIMMNYMEESGVDILYCGVTVHNSKGIALKYVFHTPRFPDIQKSIMHDNFIGSTSMVCIKKNAIQAVGLFDESLPALQDYDLFIRLINNGCSVKGYDKSLVKYYIVDQKRSISCNPVLFKHAAAKVIKKYNTFPHSLLLKRRLKIIGFKRLFKSRWFLLESIKGLLKK